jgi:hypothetical protein
MGHHVLHLLLGGATGAHHRLLDLGGRVLAHRQQGVDRRDDGAAPGLAELQAESALRAMKTRSMANSSGLNWVMISLTPS